MLVYPENRQEIAGSIERHRGEVHHYLMRRLGCMETASDMFQSIVEHMLRKAPESDIRNVRAYLFQSARNALATHFRDEKIRHRYFEASMPLVEESDGLGPQRVLEGQQELSTLEQALAELPLLTRQIFLMYRVQGLKQAAIAQRFGVSLSTVEKRLNQALNHCRSRL